MNPFDVSPGNAPAGSISNSELADMAADRVKGRAIGAGTGAPQDLTPAQALAIVRAQADAGVYVVNTANANAYQTIQAALDAGAAGSPGAYIVKLAPATYTENITVASGKQVNIESSEYGFAAVISGNVTWNPASTSSLLALRHIYVTGTIGGAATAVAGVAFEQCAVDGTITFTGSAVPVASNGAFGLKSGLRGYFNAISTTGRITLLNNVLFGALTTTHADGVMLKGCALAFSGAITSGGTTISLAASDVTSGTPTFTFSGSAGVVTADQYTLAQLLAAGSTITNGIWGSRTILTAGLELTIAGGIVTATHSRHAIDTESDGATDDLDTINGTVDGQLLVVYASDSTRTVVLKDGTGNLKLPGDVTLDNVEDVVMLINRGGTLYAVAPVSNSGA